MKKQIEILRDQLMKSILAGEYEVFRINEATHSDYLVDIIIYVDDVEFQYAVGKDLLCDHSLLKLLNFNEKEIIDHFLNVYEERFNTEEMKQFEIERLEAKIKELKS